MNRATAVTIGTAAFVIVGAYLAAGVVALLILLFVFLFYSVGDQYQRRQASERFAQREAERALEFQIRAARLQRRLGWYRRASRDRVTALLTIVAVQDQVAQVNHTKGRIESLIINGELFVPAATQPTHPKGDGTPRESTDDFDFPDVIGGEE